MIEFLRSWCEGIMINIFITIIIEMLVPEGSIKKYVRVIIGVYMVFVILNPIISKIDKINMENMFNFEDSYKVQETFANKKDVSELYVKAIESDIKEKFANISNATVTFSEGLEDIEKIEITFEKEPDNLEEIKRYIKENYQVEEGIIFVVF